MTTTTDAAGLRERITIGFLLVPNFPLLSFSAALDTLRQANRLSGRDLYRWVLVSADGAAVTSSAAVAFAADCSIETAPRCQIVIICAGIEPARSYDGHVFAWLRRLHRDACTLGAISTGAFLLAKAGLLNGRRCAVHWENAAEFHKAFPLCVPTQEIFAVDGPFVTSSGGTVTLDMMLHIVGAVHGRALAAAISQQFNHSQIRLQDEAQRMSPEARFGITNARLAQVVAAMEDAIEAPVTLGVMARRIGLTSRQVERLFRHHLGRTPSDFYLSLRMAKARALVEQSSMATGDIARACGYESASHFSRIYRRQFGSSPASVRRANRVADRP